MNSVILEAINARELGFQL